MHLPDGLLHPGVFAPLLAGAGAAVGIAARRCRRLEEESVPLMGMLGAFIFAAQIVNVPVGVGTSGHLLGTALVALALGWGPAVITLAAVLILQALILQDGGVLAVGANIVNLAVAPATVAVLVARATPGRWRHAGRAIGTALGVLVAAGLVAVELWLSGRAALGTVLVALVGTHLPIALLEGVVTALLLRFVASLRTAPAAEKEGAR